MSRDKSFVEQVMHMPWWVGALLSAGSYVFIRYIVPGFFTGGSPMLTRAVNQATPFLASLTAFVFAGAAVFSAIGAAIEKWKNNHDT
jgi:hypothetical protein